MYMYSMNTRTTCMLYNGLHDCVLLFAIFGEHALDMYMYIHEYMIVYIAVYIHVPMCIYMSELLIITDHSSSSAGFSQGPREGCAQYSTGPPTPHRTLRLQRRGSEGVP